MLTSRTSHSPISHGHLAILTALAGGPKGRTEITAEVIADTVGAIALSKGSYYRYIKELEESKYIAAEGSYTLTDKGWRTLHQELNRIERQRLILKTRLHI